LSDALGDLRVAGSVLIQESYLAPWAITVPREADLRRAVGAPEEMRVIPFHFVRQGGFTIKHPSMPAQSVGTAEVVICPSGKPHRLFDGKTTAVASLDDILAGRGPALAKPSDAGATSIICGVFQMRRSSLNPLHAALPPVIRLATVGSKARAMLARTAEMLIMSLDDAGRDAFTTARILEVLCAEALRSYLAQDLPLPVGWLRGLADPKLAPAIAAVHGQPDANWNVASLAALVSLSPSRFAARFRDSVGDTAMGYVAKWRMHLAMRRLRETDGSVESIAGLLGYGSVPAFGRAFKAIVGQSPAQWRAAHR
jgi:AraC-like DNA-binding protein